MMFLETTTITKVMMEEWLHDRHGNSGGCHGIRRCHRSHHWHRCRGQLRGGGITQLLRVVVFVPRCA